MKNIKNPVLTGFHPDPSMICVDGTYYIASSTFEWYPGVRLHKSRDMVNWQLIKSPLDNEELLHMLGNPASCGVWAPDLSYADGKFYLLYTDVKVSDGPFKQIYNLLTMADDIEGPWSKPICLKGIGFDSSIFHDDDGRKYYVQQQWDHRSYKNSFNGIVLTEFDTDTMTLMPETRRTIYEGTKVGLVEGPHIYKVNGMYYLFAAQGGTVYSHQEIVARSKSLDALSFETDPEGAFITNMDTPDFPIQKQGHGSLVETPAGEWYYASLCGRPLHRANESVYDPRGYCPLGRETSIQKVYWNDEGWPKIEGGHGGKMVVDAPLDADENFADAFSSNEHFQKDFFEKNELDLNWNTLRQPFTEKLGSVGEGKLTLKGKGPLTSCFDCAMVARRWQDFSFVAETEIEFTPEHYQQMAGMANFYNDTHWSFAYITHDEKKGRVIEVSDYNAGKYTDYLKENAIAIGEDVDRIFLKTVVERESYHYEYSFDGENYNVIPVTLDSTVLSDDYVRLTCEGFFTGAFVGLACIDMTGFDREANFYRFIYEGKDSEK